MIRAKQKNFIYMVRENQNSLATKCPHDYMRCVMYVNIDKITWLTGPEYIKESGNLRETSLNPKIV